MIAGVANAKTSAFSKKMIVLHDEKATRYYVINGGNDLSAAAGLCLPVKLEQRTLMEQQPTARCFRLESCSYA